MSDAALIGASQASKPVKKHPSISDPSQQEMKHHNHEISVRPTLQSEAAATSTDGTTSRITTDGNIIRSDDPSTRPDASMGEKLKGDFKGAINGTLGSIQAATGVAIRNEGLEQKGLDRMAEEDARLGAKHGVMPVGSNLRTEEQGAGTTRST